MRIVALEGIDGSGVSTHSRLLHARLAGAGVKSCLWKEPTEGPVGRLIRGFLRSTEGVDSDLMALLFAADRLWGLRLGVVERCGGSPEVLVVDRYKYSSLAYQGVGSGLEWVDAVNRKAPEAEILVYIDVPTEVALRRITARERREVFETPEFLERVKSMYEEVLRLARARGVKVIRVEGVRGGVERGIEDVQGEIAERVFEALGLARA
ncbi:thymidylate kinase [Aeropyrum pernix K1]|uniref:Putative thymidylate kinase n=1 Tax=Aeropyrum pernix (strain ATCC 700893 / DSM 11879 / JCM 9820 / NBRC 100138 / K1) TaxID=272557 RepID=KTHY_AERPE|nr:dTMP kinase [Aeropyrum pernix]Q9YA48.1 RecName: Full=Putative thymidylate kinase; AltName: Full=dTMP kinase [Aeropyrum pernix K1]BAA81101.1 thymidylate kinase [Aeropyrum pernix K1]